MDKIKKLERGEHLDLSSDEDLSIAVMNLISIEEHLFFSAEKTGKPEFLEILREVREMRKTLLKKLIKEYEGEVWCIAKHLLAASMRLMEVGTKALTKGEKKEAEDLFKKAYHLYSLFWGLNLGVVKTNNINKIVDEKKINLLSDDPKPELKNSSSIFEKLGVLVQKIVDCCRE